MRKRNICGSLSLNNEFRSLLLEIDIQFLECLTVMGIRYGKTVWLISIVVIVFFAGGCEEPVRTSEGTKELVRKVELGTTIGSLTEVFSVDAIAVRIPSEPFSVVA